VAFSVTIANAGTGEASGIRVRFVVDGVTLGTDRTIATFGAGASVAVTSEAWSAKHRMGLHTVEVRVDPDNAIAESNETNKCRGADLHGPGQQTVGVGPLTSAERGAGNSGSQAAPRRGP
jgi:hypothetical protein